MTRHRVTQVLREVLERVTVKRPILIHEIVAMDLYGRKELVVFTEKVSMKMQNNNY